MKNRWLRPAPDYYPVKEIQSCSAEDRLLELKSFDILKLKAVIKYPGTQKTVKDKARIYLRKAGVHTG